MTTCHQFDSKTSILDLSNCCGDVDCLVEAVSCSGCPVIPSWTLFQTTLDNAAIIVNLEAGGFDSVELLIHATEATLLAVPGIGPASLTAIQAALAVYNLETLP